MARWNRLVATRLPHQEQRILPARRAAVRLVLGEVARRAQDPPASDDSVFAVELVELVNALFAAPS